MLGVSGDMVSKIERGLTPGKRWAGAVAQLAGRGTIVNAPSRRVQRVRAPGGRTVQAAEAPPPLRRDRLGRRRFGVQRGATRHGAKSTTVDAPKRGPGRVAARSALYDDLRDHRGPGERVMILVQDRSGRTYQIGRHGGYDPNVILGTMHDEGWDIYDWISDTLDGMGYDVGAGSVASVTFVYGGTIA